MDKLRFWDIHLPDPRQSLIIELRGRLKRRHLPTEPWQRACIKIVIEHIRNLDRLRK